ncbi:hypothetical protein M9H77_19336 [Catharanthus roseus]|uniref:Uncharacterized protein n=1 Tax=Catharanthus roseus TaxID=4058 RepID=A0ACC0BA29_CATRO|nr:hypothetical protein M9H77_19336 [Catharanthus roseus]
MVVTGHWIDIFWKLQSVLSFINIPPPRGGIQISDALFNNDAAMRNMRETIERLRKLDGLGEIEDLISDKEALEQRNYELIAQIKDVNGRLQHAESGVARMDIGKAKLDEILQVGRPVGVKTSLRYVAEKIYHEAPSTKYC